MSSSTSRRLTRSTVVAVMCASKPAQVATEFQGDTFASVLYAYEQIVKDCKVIGNIYETPELLESAAQVLGGLIDRHRHRVNVIQAVLLRELHVAEVMNDRARHAADPGRRSPCPPDAWAAGGNRARSASMARSVRHDAKARIIWLLVADPTGCELIATTAVLGVLWGLATLHARVASR